MRRFDAQVALSRLARAAVCVGALLGPFAGVARAALPNDTAATAAPITMTWINAPEHVATVAPLDWQAATATGDQAPSCTGAEDHSLWWSVSVAEAGTLKVTVSSANVASFAPVITLYDSNNVEQGCAATDSAAR